MKLFKKADTSVLSKLEEFSTEELREVLKDKLNNMNRDLLFLSRVYIILKARGEDLSELTKGIGVYLPMIAEGKILPDLVIKYSGQKTLVSTISKLPIPKQEELLKDPKVEVVTFDKENKKQNKIKEVGALTVSEMIQVFDNDKIRTPEKQEKFIKDTNIKNVAETISYIKTKRLDFDKEKRTVIVGHYGIKLDVLLNYLITNDLDRI